MKSRAPEAVEAAYTAYDGERRRSVGRDDKKVAELEKAAKEKIAEADGYARCRTSLGEIVDREGGVGLNASTSSYDTRYYFSFPSNRVELWGLPRVRALPEAGAARVLQGARRRDEERRMRTESNPIGRMIEQFLVTSSSAHPYGSPSWAGLDALDAFSARTRPPSTRDTTFPRT